MGAKRQNAAIHSDICRHVLLVLGGVVSVSVVSAEVVSGAESGDLVKQEATSQGVLKSSFKFATAAMENSMSEAFSSRSHAAVILLTIGVAIAIVLFFVGFCCGFYVGKATSGGGGPNSTMFSGARGVPVFERQDTHAQSAPVRVRSTDNSPSRKELSTFEHEVPTRITTRRTPASTPERRPKLGAELNFYYVGDQRKENDD